AVRDVGHPDRLWMVLEERLGAAGVIVEEQQAGRFGVPAARLNPGDPVARMEPADPAGAKPGPSTGGPPARCVALTIGRASPGTPRGCDGPGRDPPGGRVIGGRRALAGARPAQPLIGEFPHETTRARRP